MRLVRVTAPSVGIQHDCRRTRLTVPVAATEVAGTVVLTKPAKPMLFLTAIPGWSPERVGGRQGPFQTDRERLAFAEFRNSPSELVGCHRAVSLFYVSVHRG